VKQEGLPQQRSAEENEALAAKMLRANQNPRPTEFGLEDDDNNALNGPRAGRGERVVRLPVEGEKKVPKLWAPDTGMTPREVLPGGRSIAEALQRAQASAALGDSDGGGSREGGGGASGGGGGGAGGVEGEGREGSEEGGEGGGVCREGGGGGGGWLTNTSSNRAASCPRPDASRLRAGASPAPAPALNSHE